MTITPPKRFSAPSARPESQAGSSSSNSSAPAASQAPAGGSGLPELG
jgi:hypothetical protein